MKIIICDVGDAASAFVIAKNGYTMMIDCGSNVDKTNPIDVFNSMKKWSNTKPYITKLGKSYPLALLHITHPDDDHVRNANEVKLRLEPYLLIRNYCEEFPDGKDVNSDYIQEIDKVYRSSNPETINWGFEINEICGLSVETCKNDSALQSKIRNNSSIIRYIKEDGVGILFCGDLEKAGWERLITDNPLFIRILKQEGVNILIAPHHGHKSGFPKALFDEIGTVNVIIHSKDTEASKEGTDVSSQYTAQASGKYYLSFSDDENCYFGKILTTRSNGNIYIETNEYGKFSIITDTSSSNHTKIKIR